MQRAQTLLVSLVALTLLAPIALAETKVSLTGLRILDADDKELRIAPQNGLVTFEIVASNTGDTTIAGPLTARLKIEMADGTESQTQDISRPGPLAPGDDVIFTYGWSKGSRPLGDYRATAQMTDPSFPEALAATFQVAKSGVASGKVVDRVIDYYWLFGLVAVSMIVFFVVLAARRS